jgi:hypothetical protein
MNYKHILFIKRMTLDYNSHKHLGKFDSDSYRNVNMSGQLKACLGKREADCWKNAVKQCKEMLAHHFDGEKTIDIIRDIKFTVMMEDIKEDMCWDGQVMCNGDYTIQDMILKSGTQDPTAEQLAQLFA